MISPKLFIVGCVDGIAQWSAVSAAVAQQCTLRTGECREKLEYYQCFQWSTTKFHPASRNSALHLMRDAKISTFQFSQVGLLYVFMALAGQYKSRLIYDLWIFQVR